MTAPRSQRLLRYLSRYRVHFGVGAALLVATNLLALRIPREIGRAVQMLRDARASGGTVDVSAVGAIALTIVALALAAGLTRVFSRIAVFNGARHIEYDLRNDVFAHLARLDRATLGRSATGDLVSRCVNDVTHVRLLFGVGILNLVNTAVAYAIVLALMVSVSPHLTLLSLAPYPFVFLGMQWFTRALFSRSMRAQQQLSALSARAQEALSGITVVKAFAVEHEIGERFAAESERYVARNIEVAIARGGLMPFMRAAAGVGTVIVLWAGGTAVIENRLTLGNFVEFSAYVVSLAWPTMGLGWVLAVYNRGAAAFDRTCEILAMRPGVDPRQPGTRTLAAPPHVPEIRFENVTLQYPDGEPALQGVNLRIRPGTTVAVVGPTGAGKSSLVQLVPRLRDPTEGQVLVDGVPATELPLDDLRAFVGYVPQDAFLFSRSLRENLEFGSVGGDGDVERAVELAGLDADLGSLPDGLDTPVGERGVTLSGGQRQRATLARALLRNPSVLVLDDALSAVDTHTERRILEGLRHMFRGRTTIVVTHRYNALDVVDEVVVLERGRVVERGTHRALIASGGRYAELVEEQRLEEEADRFEPEDPR